MHVFTRGECPVIAAPVQRDVDGIPKGSHFILLKRANLSFSVFSREREDGSAPYILRVLPPRIGRLLA
jgi:hypothetical protein